MQNQNNQNMRSRLVVQLLILVSVCLAALGLFLAIGVFRRPVNSHNVQMRVESSGGFAMITFSAGSQEVRQAMYMSTPWNKSMFLASGTEIYVVAGNPSQTGKVTCKIKLDNRAWKEKTAEESNKSVACAGIVP
jgi:hypothetical protein